MRSLHATASPSVMPCESSETVEYPATVVHSASTETVDMLAPHTVEGVQVEGEREVEGEEDEELVEKALHARLMASNSSIANISTDSLSTDPSPAMSMSTSSYIDEQPILTVDVPEFIPLHLRKMDYRNGEVVERETVDLQGHDLESGFYPIEALVEGVLWPQDVVTTKREEYLSPDDFQKVFKMNKEAFAKLANHVKTRLKKEKKLF